MVKLKNVNKKKLIIYWSRRDFRLRDNRALLNALTYIGEKASNTEALFLPVFVAEPYMTKLDPKYQFGAPSRFALSRMVPAFASHFSMFFIIHTQAAAFFRYLYKSLSSEFDIELFVNEDIHPDFYTQLKKIRDCGITVHLAKDQLTINRNVKTSVGNLYSVFTPFKNAVWQSFVSEKECNTVTPHQLTKGRINYFELNKIGSLSKYIFKILTSESDVDTSIASLDALFATEEKIQVGTHTIDLNTLGLPKREIDFWYTTEKQALSHLKKYVEHEMSTYKDNRDSLEADRTSKMSLALAWGLV